MLRARGPAHAVTSRNSSTFRQNVARFRLDRHRSLQVNTSMRFSALFKSIKLSTLRAEFLKISVPLTHLFSYHEISRMPTYGCRLQHKAYNCRRNFEWKRKRAFSERLYISGIPSMYNLSGSKYDFSFQL